jgi:hypothetical protein
VAHPVNDSNTVALTTPKKHFITPLPVSKILILGLVLHQLKTNAIILRKQPLFQQCASN